jgi:hypothetical protein
MSIENQENLEKKLEMRTNDFALAKKVIFELRQNLLKAGYNLEFPELKNGYMFVAKSSGKTVIAKLTDENKKTS